MQPRLVIQGRGAGADHIRRHESSRGNLLSRLASSRINGADVASTGVSGSRINGAGDTAVRIKRADIVEL